MQGPFLISGYIYLFFLTNNKLVINGKNKKAKKNCIISKQRQVDPQIIIRAEEDN